MDTKDLTVGAHRQLRTFTAASLVLLIVSLLWLLINLYGYQVIRAKSPSADGYITFIETGFLPALLLYLTFAVMLFFALNRITGLKLLGILSVVTGAVSFMALMFGFAALQDIYRDYLNGNYACTGEWASLYVGTVLHLIFYIIGFITVISLRTKTGKWHSDKRPVSNEVIFEVTQYVGVVCGAVGIVFTLFTLFQIIDKNFSAHLWLIRIILIYCLIIFFPYVSVMLYWILMLARKKNLSLYDEKQKHDLATAGLTAWLISIPVMLGIFIPTAFKISWVLSILWFPLYLFVTLLVFSISVLYNFKRG